MGGCKYYKNEKSCFTCPLPDCNWTPKDRIPMTREELDEHYRFKLHSAERDLAISKSDIQTRRAKDKIAYWTKKIEASCGGGSDG